MKISKKREITFAVFLFLACVLIFTWPLVLHIADAIPGGSEPAPVAIVHLFGPQWTGVAMEEHKPYWSPPFFYPYQGAFAFGEPEPLFCVLVWIIAKLAGYILAYNLVIILYLAGSGLAAYGIARLLTDDHLASLWCGIWLTGGAYSLQQLCHTPLLATVFPLGCIFFMLLAFRDNSRLFFWSAVFMYIFTWFTSKQVALYLTIVLPAAILPQVLFIKGRFRALGDIFWAVVLVIVSVLPYSLAQLKYASVMGFEWNTSHALEGALSVRSLLVPAYGHWLTTRILGWNISSWDIGLVPLLVILLALCAGFTRFKGLDNFQKRILAGILAMIVVALVVGFGPKINQSFFVETVLGGKFIRSAARSSVFAVFGVAVISALAFAYLRGRFQARGARVAVTSILYILLFAEMWTMPIVLVFPDEEVRGQHGGAVNYLRSQGQGAVILELPLPTTNSIVDRDIEAGAQYRMLAHGNPVINGYASFAPPSRYQLRDAFYGHLEERARRYLDAYDIRYVLLHNHKISISDRETYARILGGKIVYDHAEHTIYLLPQRTPYEDMLLLPSSVFCAEKIPQKGHAYALPLEKPAARAVLIKPQPDWYIEFKWVDGQGRIKLKKVRILGSLILDAGQDRLYLRILDFPKGSKYGEALLIPIENIKE